MRALAGADRVEYASIWMATLAFFFVVVLAALSFYLFRQLYDIQRNIVELQNEVDSLKKGQTQGTSKV